MRVLEFWGGGLEIVLNFYLLMIGGRVSVGMVDV